MNFLMDGHAVAITTLSDLHQQCGMVLQQPFSEVWLEAEGEGPSLAMLKNGTHAFLMYLHHPDGDPGFSSRDPYYAGSAEATVEFLLSNEQMDEKPIAWTLPLEEALVAFEYFLLSQGGRSPDVVWHDDSLP